MYVGKHTENYKMDQFSSISSCSTKAKMKVDWEFPPAIDI